MWLDGEDPVVEYRREESCSTLLAGKIFVAVSCCWHTSQQQEIYKNLHRSSNSKEEGVGGVLEDLRG